MLVIALEPEAASLYCRRLEIDHFICGEGGAKSANFKPGTNYMVIDAGGKCSVRLTVENIGCYNTVDDEH